MFPQLSSHLWKHPSTSDYTVANSLLTNDNLVSVSEYSVLGSIGYYYHAKFEVSFSPSPSRHYISNGS